nr:Retrovirus-related Pol polyprotein from transposon TNT 1-94 [Cajanus cajan]
MKYYLLGQDLWSIVRGAETTPPTDEENLKKWKVRCGKALYVLSISVEDEFLQRIKDLTTSKEAWDTLETLFTKKNDAKLQLLENKLMSLRQGDMAISQYFTKVKSICNEIAKLDPQNVISETRMRRIIIFGLNPKYNGIITAIRGWAKEPTLTELESILANQEALDNQMSKVSINEEDKARFSKKGGRKEVQAAANLDSESKGPQRRQGWQKGQHKKGPEQRGATQSRFKDYEEQKRYRRKDGRCYNCGKKGHYVRECWARKEEGNTVTLKQDENKEEWDVHASYAVKESRRDEGVEIVASCMDELVEESTLVTVSEAINYDDDWIVDSGCSNHMTGDKGKFLSMSEYKGERVVVTANNSKMPIFHIEKAAIVPRFSPHQVEVDNVYHVPGIKKNLLSVSQLTTLGNYVVFGPKDVGVYRRFKPICPAIMKGRRLESVYVMSAQEAYVNKARKNETADLWHARLEHVSYNRFKAMMK